LGKRGNSGKGWQRGLLRGLRVSLASMTIVCCALGLLGCSDPMNDALTFEKQGNLTAALAIYTNVLASDPEDTRALRGSAVILMMAGRYDEALVAQEQLVKLDPSDAQTRVELGFNYLNHQDRPQDAVQVLGEAVALEASARNLCYLAQAQEGSGDAHGAEAEQTLRRAIDTEPSYAYSYQLLESLLRAEGRADEADIVRQQAVTLGVDATSTSVEVTETP
jgi:tetratricopeptide (TPR) repeat protein